MAKPLSALLILTFYAGHVAATSVICSVKSVTGLVAFTVEQPVVNGQAVVDSVRNGLKLKAIAVGGLRLLELRDLESGLGAESVSENGSDAVEVRVFMRQDSIQANCYLNR